MTYQFVCAECGKLCNSTSTQEEVEKEAIENFGEHILESDYGSVCDRCYEILMKAIRG